MTTFLTAPCEGCGAQFDEATFIFDLQGCALCPECAEGARIPCSVCGSLDPVRIYPEDGSNPTGEVVAALPLPNGDRFEVDDITGCEDYIAVCRSCDNPDGVMR